MQKKKILAKFSLPKKILESKISTPKNLTFDHPHHLKSRVPLPPPGYWVRSCVFLQVPVGS